MFCDQVIQALPAVERFTRKYAGARFSADLMSEIKVTALELGYEDRGNKIESWLIEIAKNKCKQEYKYNRTHPLQLIDMIPEEISHVDYQPCRLVELDYLKLINQLPKLQRRILKLTIIGYKCREIAAKLHLKQTTVKTALWIAKNTLKNKLKAQATNYSLV